MPEQLSYYINLFTAETWREIRENAGWAYTGHREGARNRARVRPGDVLLCYVTRTSAFVGALRVLGPVYEIEHEDPRTWGSDLYPVRFKTELLVRVPIAHGVQLSEVRAASTNPSTWSWVFRGSLNEIPTADAEWILRRLHETEPKLGADDPEPGQDLSLDTDPDIDAPDEQREAEREPSRHSRIQFLLTKLGRDLGLDVWVAANDRSVLVDGVRLGDLSVESLPRGLPDDVRRRIGLIDVIWLRRNSYFAAFEIEATTSILTGLARMGDLLALVPNLDIPFFIVAPEDRRGKVFEQITRPLFAHGLERPLHRQCRLISFEALEADIASLGQRVGALDPARYLDTIAEEAP